VVIHRPLKATPADKYLPCTFCYGFYAKKSLARHIERCTFNKDKASGKAAAKTGRALLYSHLTTTTEDEQSWAELVSGLSKTHANPGKHYLLNY